jgi:hypothetical protein
LRGDCTRRLRRGCRGVHVLMYDQWTELSFQVPNPDFGKPITQVLPGHPPEFQAPFQMRVGARFSF